MKIIDRLACWWFGLCPVHLEELSHYTALPRLDNVPSPPSSWSPYIMCPVCRRLEEAAEDEARITKIRRRNNRIRALKARLGEK